MTDHHIAAIHEGAHAAVAWQFGFRVRRVVLCPPGRAAAGYCEIENWKVELDLDPVRAAIYVLSGSAAVKRFTGRPAWGDECDREQAAIIASAILELPVKDPRVRDMMKSLEALATALMADPHTAAAIERNAKALEAKGALSGDDVERLCKARR